MRKITFLIALFVCSIGFSQSTALSNMGGDNNPQYTQQQKTVDKGITVERSSESSVLSNTSGVNNPVYYNDVTTYYQDPVQIQEELDASALESSNNPIYLFEGPRAQQTRSMAVIVPNAGATETFAAATGDFFYDPTDGVTGGVGGDCSTTSSGDPGDYPNCGCTTTTTLTGTGLEVEFLSFRVFGTFDVLNIYDGPDTSSPQIYDSNLNSDTDTLAGMIVSNGSAVFTSTSDALTFEFSATAVVNTCGWEVEVLSGGGGGGGGAPCDETNPSFAFENGRGCSINNNWTAANDFTVAAGSDAVLNTIIPNIFMNPGANASSVDVTIYDDAGGLPGAIVDQQLAVVPTSEVVLGSNFGFDISAVTMDLAPVALPGDAGTDTTYWVAIQVTTSDGGNAFWEDSGDTAIGNPLAFDDGSGFIIPDPLRDGVYTYVAECTPNGGGGGAPCSESAPSNAFEQGYINDPGSGFITANDYTVPADTDFELEQMTLNLFHDVGATVDMINITYHADAGGLPGAIIGSESVAPTGQVVVGNNFGFDVSEVDMDVTPFAMPGQAGVTTTYWIATTVETSTNGLAAWEAQNPVINGFTTASFAGGAWGSVVEDGVYIFNGNCTPIGGGPTNDECAGATPVLCDDVIVGTTSDNTDTGGNAAADEWYSFTGTGTPQVVTVSLCDGGTDYDSLLRIFDACGGNEIATNDDSCGLQSELSFLSDGTTTYFIMVEGFGSNDGNFSMAITCVDPPPNDDCAGALDIACGETVVGETNTATFDATAPVCVTGITAPGVWYTFTDDSGLITDYTLSMCDGGTDYDSKITVYSGDCGALACVVDNDDTCGLQSEVAWQGDGSTTYYILVHGFAANTGNFSLALACTPVPPPNDMIVNSIDVDEIGFPYTDPAVAMPAATTEAGNPAGCNIDGANGVWYNFVPDGDGFATATITSPAGASFVNFFTADSESATEDELTLVDFNGNQCAPQTDAIIPTTAGQAYYVFVVNTDGITDIVIDGNNLGTNDNTIEGFTYYPNPATDVLNLNSIDTIDTVAIYNILGQQVLNNDVAATSGTLDVSNLAVGAYIMKVTVNGEVGTYKIIKR